MSDGSLPVQVIETWNCRSLVGTCWLDLSPNRLLGPCRVQTSDQPCWLEWTLFSMSMGRPLVLRQRAHNSQQ